MILDSPLDVLDGARVSSAVANGVKTSAQKAGAARMDKGKDKADRATVEQAIDPRTRMVRGIISCCPN
jgi:serine/threonine-protein kinase RIO1